MGTMNYADPLGHLETCQSVGRNGINNHVSKFDDFFDKMSELADQFWDIPCCRYKLECKNHGG